MNFFFNYGVERRTSWASQVKRALAPHEPHQKTWEALDKIKSFQLSPTEILRFVHAVNVKRVFLPFDFHFRLSFFKRIEFVRPSWIFFNVLQKGVDPLIIFHVNSSSSLFWVSVAIGVSYAKRKSQASDCGVMKKMIVKVSLLNLNFHA